MTTQHKIKTSSWKNKFREKLIEILGKDGVISSEDELLAYDCDALTGYRIKLIFVVLSENTEQV